MPFPILRTRPEVLSEIISLLEPNEIVTASFCSKNVKRLLKGYYKQSEPLEWRLFMTNYDAMGGVSIETSKDGGQKTVIAAKHISVLKGRELEDTNGFLRGFSQEHPVLYFNDRVLGTKLIVDYVTDLFNLDVHGLIIDINGIWAIDWIHNRREKTLESFEFYMNHKYNSNADEALDYVLRNTHVSHYCAIGDNVSDDFKFDGKLGPMKQLYISSKGHWVTCDNLKNFDCRDIGIQGSRLSVQDLNSFLRHWRAGGSSRMEWLHLNFEEHTFQEKFDEDLEVVKTDEERVYRSSCDGWERVFNGGYSIQRADGAKAMIQCNLGRVTASFCSKNVERLLKTHYQQRKPLEWRLIMLDYDSEGLVDIKTSEEGKQITVIAAKDISVLNGNDMKYINGYLIGFASSQYPVFYFNDQVLGTKMIVDYVTRLFGCLRVTF
ncbi:hypothetical protein B9Z55_015854 [Caenorhabditis nigoni]|uniref:F-box domain-containing protein n=1 Tax=Caenorhabditis nigoni TaxID=1611254 RepID=A0A2G5UC24_9PELO|nr:hypothetical protein B9Z55_015854 [Caenorhabditis nigoni]